ncbi:MAG: glycosyltransferase [Candidatus Tectimicrobiota bacterium]
MSCEHPLRPSLRRVAMFSVHSCPLAPLGGRDTGGMNVYVRELSRLLGRQGIAVDIYTRCHDPWEPTVVECGPQARVIHLPAGPAAPYTKHRIWEHLPGFVESVQTFAATHDLHYDLLHSHYWLSGWVALQLRQMWSLPMVHMSHTLGYPKNAAAQQLWEQDPPRRLQVEYEVLGQSDALVAESPASKQHMVHEYGVDPTRIQVIPCGVDTTLFQPQSRQQARQALGLPETVPVLLFVGRLQPLKGIGTLLRAAHVVRQHYADLRVCIVGGGVDGDDPHEAEELGRLRALGQQLHLQPPQLAFIKAQTQDMLAQYYAAADVFVMPSHYESFGMVVVEAMACGTPVVASCVGGMASTVLHEQTGLLVPVGDWQAFAQAIMRVIASPAFRDTLGAAGVQRAQTYAWSRIGERNLQLYYRLLRRQSPASCGLAASGQ